MLTSMLPIQTFAKEKRETSATYHVMANTGIDEGNTSGTHEAPFLTIGKALEYAKSKDLDSVNICLDSDIQISKGLVFDARGMQIKVFSCNENSEVNTLAYDSDLAEAIGNKDGVIKVTGGTMVTFENVKLKNNTDKDGRVLYVADDAEVTLIDAQVSGGNVNNANENGGGAGIYVDQGGSVFIQGSSVIKDNETTGGGGGLYVADGGYAEVTDTTTFKANTAKKGAGIYAATQTSSYGGLCMKDDVSVTGNVAVSAGSGIYVEADAEAKVSGSVQITDNKLNRVQNNIFLSPNATLDIAGTTTEAKLGITADPAQAYRLISLPTDNYTIQGTTAGDEAGWTYDTDQWDIRYMKYNDVEGLYLYYKTMDVRISDVNTLTAINGSTLGGDATNYLSDSTLEAENSNGVLTVKNIVATDGGDYEIEIICDADAYRIPTKDIISVSLNGQNLSFNYEANIENGSATLTIPVAELLGKTGILELVVSAEKYAKLTLKMDGPLYEMTSSITGYSSPKLVMNSLEGLETGKLGYKITRNNRAVSGVTVELVDSVSNLSYVSKVTDENGEVVFGNLPENASYTPILDYEDTFNVIARDEITVALSTLFGQELDSSYQATVGTVNYQPQTQTATITNVNTDGEITFGIQQSKDTIVFIGNEGNATTKPATLSMTSKEMNANATTYGQLATASLSGYIFLGWFTSATGGEQITATTAYHSETSAKTLYAHWEPAGDVAYQIQHWVEYVKNGENARYTQETQTKTVDGITYYLFETTNHDNGVADSSITISALDLKDMSVTECEWWTRAGFAALAEENCVVKADGSSVFCILYDRNAYKVSFKTPVTVGSAINNSTIEEQETDFGTAVGELPMPTLPGYTFVGWYDEGNNLWTKESILKQAENLELIAHWKANSTTNWAITIMLEKQDRNADGSCYGTGTYEKSKVIYQDNDGNLLTGTSDETITFAVDSISALVIEGFNYVGYAPEGSESGVNLNENSTHASVLVKPTDAGTDKNGFFNEEFDGGMVYLYYTRKRTNIKFEDGDGNEVPSDKKNELVFGGDFTGQFPDTPSKDGYDFIEWEDKDGNTVDENTPADDYVKDGEDLTLTPVWKARKYNLTYIPGTNGKFIPASGQATISATVPGGYVDPNQVEYDKPMGKMGIAEKAGYRFTGWFVNDSQITEDTLVDINSVVISNADKTPPYSYEDTRPLVARYTPYQYTIILDAGSKNGVAGAVAPDRVTVSYGEEIQGLPVPVLKGYRFVGWQLDINDPATAISNGKVWNWAYADGTEVVAHAIWVPESYRYVFDLNDRTGSTRASMVDTTIDYVEITFDSYYDGVFSVEAVRNGYTFNGWSLTVDGAPLTADDIVRIASNTTLYAVWKANVYDVRLNIGSGSLGDLSSMDSTAVFDVAENIWVLKVPFDTTYGSLPIPMKQDCTYQGYVVNAPGWPAKEGYGITIHNEIITLLPQYIDYLDADGITLTAIMEPWITFDPDGGVFTDGGTEAKKELQSDIQVLPDVQKEGYTQKGWTNATGELVDLDDVKNMIEPDILKPNYVLNISFDPDGGAFKDNNSSEMRVCPKDEINVLPEVSKDGYTHKGWSTPSGELITLEDVQNITEPIVLKPNYVANISLNPAGGKFMDDNSSEVRILPQDEITVLPQVSKEGFVYDGWANAEGEKIDLDDIKNSREPMTIMPVFYAVITFDANGGTVNDSELFAMRMDQLKELPIAIRASYTFLGWYDSKNGGAKVSLDTLKANKLPVTVYARWSYNGGGSFVPSITVPKTAKFTFVTNGGSAVEPVTVAVNSLLEKPTSVREFYSLIGWFTNEELTQEWDFAKDRATEDITLYASWRYVGPSAYLTTEHIAYINGYEDGTVRPLANITRAEVAMIFYRLLNSDVRVQYETNVNTFTDVESDAWYNTAISTLANMNILLGRDDGRFDPSASITRAELAAVCSRFDVLEKTATMPFVDVPEEHWAYDLIGSVASKGWVKGVGNDCFAPDCYITRAEVVTLINRVLARATEAFNNDTCEEILWPDNHSDNWFYVAIQEASNTHKAKISNGIETWLPFEQTEGKVV